MVEGGNQHIQVHPREHLHVRGVLDQGERQVAGRSSRHIREQDKAVRAAEFRDGSSNPLAQIGDADSRRDADHPNPLLLAAYNGFGRFGQVGSEIAVRDDEEIDQ